MIANADGNVSPLIFCCVAEEQIWKELKKQHTVPDHKKVVDHA